MLVLFIILAIGLFCLVAYLIMYMYKEAFSNRVVYHDFSFSDFPDSFGTISLFFISDIHKREISDDIINEAKGKVDLVIIGGDLLEKGVPIERVSQNIKKLKEIGPIYFVWGNNDYEVDYHLLDATLLEFGVKILDNTAVSFESDAGERFILLGTDDVGLERDQLDLALQDAGEGGFRVLISHNPRIIDKIEMDHNIRLILSGHTHGGQIHILGYSPYEIGGYKQLGRTNILISNGYGTTGLPFRLGARAETHIIKIKRG